MMYNKRSKQHRKTFIEKENDGEDENNYDLSNVLNSSKLETILNVMNNHMKEQSMRIERLENELSLRPSAEIFASHLENMHSFTETVTQRLDQLENQQNNITSFINQHIENIQENEQILSNKVDKEFLNNFELQLNQRMNKLAEDIQVDKADASQLKNIEISQHHLVEDFKALEQVVCRKVDQSEVPLLKSASKEISGLIKFRKDLVTIIKQIQEELLLCGKSLKEKESKEAIVKRMQSIHNKLMKKMDIKYAQDNIIDRIENIEERLASAMNTNVQTFRVKKSEWYKRIMDVENGMVELQNELENISEYMNENESKTKHTINTVEKLNNNMKQISLKNVRESEANIAYLNEVRNDLLQMKSTYNDIVKKVDCTMQFVDWFTNSRFT